MQTQQQIKFNCHGNAEQMLHEMGVNIRRLVEAITKPFENRDKVLICEYSSSQGHAYLLFITYDSANEWTAQTKAALKIEGDEIAAAPSSRVVAGQHNETLGAVCIAAIDALRS